MSFTPLPTDPARWRLAGERVIEYRRAHGVKKNGRRQPMTQEVLAKRAGVSQGCLQAFENNTRATQFENVQRIAAAVEMTLDQLFAPGNVAFELGRARALVADSSIFVSSAEADGPYSVEANAVRKLFVVAFTRERLFVLMHLVTHVKNRTDPAAIAMVEELQLAGLEPIPNGPPSAPPPAPSKEAAASVHVMPPNGKESLSVTSAQSSRRRKTGGR